MYWIKSQNLQQKLKIYLIYISFYVFIKLIMEV